MSRVKKIFNDALELETVERENFLRETCGGDAALRAEVDSLLASYNRVEGFLQTPAAAFSASEMATRVLESEEASAVGKLVGAYRIEKEIGRGGMGAVYLAVRADEHFQKRVAIKLLRRGLENETVISRFQNERQILADLEHPSIARLIDGGTTESGLPYFVMEYVEGSPVNRFCAEQNLVVAERLKLFREVCAAVEYAHEHCIVHRDIKPSNILVTKAGTPKLLDFGIAKTVAATGLTSSTATALRVMTPEYASPEQMRGERVGKPSDIYNLGLLLYELLTGHRAYDFAGKSPYEVVREVCEDEPVKPSDAAWATDAHSPGTDDSRLKSDLDLIILKALRKEPQRRYTSVREFSEDVGRLLAGLPVAARQDTLLYRTGKILRRHRTAAASGLAVALVFLLVGSFLNYFNGRADRGESNTAKGSASISQNLATEKQKGGTDNREARDLYFKAQALWNQRTFVSIQQAAALFQHAIDTDPEFALAYSGLSNSYFLLSVWGRVPPWEAFPKARAASLRAIQISPEAAEGHLSLAMVHWLYEYEWEAADREFRKALALNPTYARAPHWYGLFLAEMGRFDEAVRTEQLALEIEPNSPPINADLARVLFYARRYDESLEQYRKTSRMDPNFSMFYTELSELYEAMGMADEWVRITEILGGFGKTSLKQAYLTGGMNGYRRAALELTLATDLNSWESHYYRAELYASLGKKDEAFDELNKALEVRDHRMAQLKVEPRLDSLRSDPRFSALLKRMKLNT
jgi:serine/threonine protein kinase/Tfp pilus assembly protein PilF